MKELLEGDAAQVWAAEEAYWQYVKAHDAKNYLALWADDFAGWPIFEDHPIRKADIDAFANAKGGLNDVISYELDRESVEVYGDAGIAFYRHGAPAQRRRFGVHDDLSHDAHVDEAQRDVADC